MKPQMITIYAAATLLICSCAQMQLTSENEHLSAASSGQIPLNNNEKVTRVNVDPNFEFDTKREYQPISVDISKVKKLTPWEFHPDSPRYLKHRSTKGGESFFTEEQRQALLEQSYALKPDSSIQIATDKSGTLAPGSLSAFDSMDFTETNGYTPPDLELAAGPNHLIAVANSAMEVYNKSGISLVGSLALNSLFSGTVCGDTANFLAAFDPNVLYDEAYDRFIIGVDQVDGSSSNHYCVAVSQTNDPTTTWNVYSFNTLSGGAWMDYPHAGVGDDAIYMGGNMFGAGFTGGRVWAFDKQAMYAGLPATAASVVMPSGLNTPQPINLHGFNQGTWPVGDPHYIMMSNGFVTSSITVLSWDNPFNGTNGVLSNLGSITLGTAALPVASQQSGAGNFATHQDSRVLDFEYRNGYGWTNHTTACNPGGGTVNCLRWAQIDLSSITLGPAGTGTFGSDGDYRIYPDLAVNHCNDMSIGYTHTSSTTFPSIRYTGRESGDAANILQAENTLINATVPYTASSSRWGDYTGMTIDPDGETFWYLGQYSKVIGGGNNWGSHIGSFSYGSCNVAVPPAADAYIRDLPADNGYEPDPVPGNMWTSSGIWNSLDNAASGGHQNPEFGQVNHMFAQLINNGPNQTPTDINGRVHFYYANAATGLSWDVDWTEFGSVSVSSLPAWGFANVSAPFDPPGTGHYCIVARWVSDQDPMTFAEGSSINTNTRNNNNIAWRNMNVVNEVLLPEGVINEVIVRNISKNDGFVGLGVLDYSERAFLEFGTVTLRLEDKLLERWLQNGAQGEGIAFDEKTRDIVIKSPQARLYQITLGPREEFKAKLIFKAPEPTGQKFHVSLTQFDAQDKPVGGVDYQIQRVEQGK